MGGGGGLGMVSRDANGTRLGAVGDSLPPPPPPSRRLDIHIDVRVAASSAAPLSWIAARVAAVASTAPALVSGAPLAGVAVTDPALAKHVVAVRVGDFADDNILDEEGGGGLAAAPPPAVWSVDPAAATLHIHPYVLEGDGGPAAIGGGAAAAAALADDAGPDGDAADADGANGADGTDDGSAYEATPLPAAHLEGLWESLHYDTPLKRRLLCHAATALRFAAAGVAPHLVMASRVVLLHGPPGTGKSSLAAALGHKLATRLVPSVYTHAVAVTVSPAAVYSRWFSESAKRVTALFRSIRTAAADGTTLVVVVVDEVESLTTARLGGGGADSGGRGGGGGGGDPGDAMRVVNALLTQLDTLRRVPNVLTLTTSNLPSAVDTAFVDRADIKAYVGLPSVTARRAVLSSAVTELLRAGLLTADGDEDAVAPTVAAVADHGSLAPTDPVLGAEAATALDEAAAATGGLSGRTLRRLPLLAAAAAPGASSSGGGVPPTVSAFVRRLPVVAAAEAAERAALEG